MREDIMKADNSFVKISIPLEWIEKNIADPSICCIKALEEFFNDSRNNALKPL